MARADRGETLWSSLVGRVRGIAAQGRALVEAMGIVPRSRDPLVPERAGRLSPNEWAAAQAVASGVRHLSQNEAGFSKLALIGASLNLGAPSALPTSRRASTCWPNGSCCSVIPMA
jgi:hypothetical protein